MANIDTQKIRCDFAKDLAVQFMSAIKNNRPIFNRKTLPYDYKSSARFTGANLLKCLLTDYEQDCWMTFSVVANAAANISGQKATRLLQWFSYREKTTSPKLDSNGRPVLDENGDRVMVDRVKTNYRLIPYNVFNLSQISNLGRLHIEPPKSKNFELEKLVNDCPVEFVEGNANIYSATRKQIILTKESMNDLSAKVEQLCRWALTECLNYQGGLYGGEEDARAELRTRLALGVLFTEAGIEIDPFKDVNHTYVARWEQLLANDPTEILRAATGAEQIIGLFESLQATLKFANEMTPKVSNLSEANLEEIEMNLHGWNGKVFIRPESCNADGQWVATDSTHAQRHSIYAVRKFGDMVLIAHVQDREEAEKFAEKLQALHSEKLNEKKEQNTDKRFFLEVFDKDKEQYMQKVARIKEAGGRFDRETKRWFLPANATPEVKESLKEFWQKKQRTHAQQNVVMDAREELRQAIIQMGLKPGADDPIMDGKIHRIPLSDDQPGQRSGSYVAYLNEGRGWPAGVIENFRTGEKRTWRANGTGHFVSAEQRSQLREQAEAVQAERQAALQKQYDEAALICQKEYEACAEAKAPTAYLQNKGITQADFEQLSSVKLDAEGRLVVPLQDTEGKIWSTEKIHSNGFKQLAKGAQKTGHFSVIETAAQKHRGLDKADVILICEGYSTGVSLALATHQPVVMAVDAGNLPAVAKQLREKYPDKPFIICGDDDRQNRVNKGREKALEAAKAIDAEVVFPTFDLDETGKEFTDFNDLATKSRLGRLAVEQQVGEVINRVIKHTEQLEHGQTQSHGRTH